MAQVFAIARSPPSAESRTPRWPCASSRSIKRSLALSDEPRFLRAGAPGVVSRAMSRRGRVAAVALAVLAALGLAAAAGAWALAHLGLRISLAERVLVGIDGRVPFRARIERP